MRKPIDPAKEHDRLREKVSRGLRAEQAMPFIRPYLDMRKEELLRSLKYYTDSGDRDKAYDVSVRLSEIETIFDEVRRETMLGRKAETDLSGGTL